MSTVRDKDGREWLMSRLQSYRHGRDRDVQMFFDGYENAVHVHFGDYIEALKTPRMTMPAVPGTLVLFSHIDTLSDADFETEECVWDEVVIAWALTYDGEILPITAFGVKDDGSAIQHPDGRVESDGQAFDTRGDFIAGLRRQDAARRAEARKVAGQ